MIKELGTYWKQLRNELEPDLKPDCCGDLTISNYPTVMECLERRMQRQPELRVNMTKQINEYVAKGYFHRATDEELRLANSERIWYFPLGVVFNPKEPNKVRLIWDAS